ncbi:MAG: MFS transporter [Pseudomonadota bacterium]
MDNNKADNERIDYAKLTSLGALHMAQYFPAAFTGIALPAIFRKEGLPLEMFWLLALPAIPRWFKWLIALVVDNYGSTRIGVRKTWIIPCTFIGALLYYSLSFLQPTTSLVYVIVAILVVKSLIMAAQDIAVDGFAAESLNDNDRAIGTSIIIFMATLGSAIGGSLMTGVERFGWSTTMTVASGLLIVTALPAILRKEPPPPPESQKRRERGESASLIRAFTRPESKLIMPYLFAFGFGATFMGALFSAFLVDPGVALSDIGIILPIAGFIGAGGGAFITPFIVHYLGLKGAGVAGMIFLPIEGLTFAWLSTLNVLPGTILLTFILSMLFFTTSIYSYAVNNSRFRWASKSQAGTDFSMQSSIWNFGVWAAGSSAGFIAAWFGYTMYFIIAAVLATSFAAWYVFMFDYLERLVQIREQEELANSSDKNTQETKGLGS